MKGNGGPAFPFPSDADAGEPGELGMTLRDYFAAKALPWVASDLPACDDFSKRVAEFAYQMADAMLEARQ